MARDYSHYVEAERKYRTPKVYNTFVITRAISYLPPVSIIFTSTNITINEQIDELTLIQPESITSVKEFYNATSPYIYKSIYTTITHCIDNHIDNLIIQNNTIPKALSTLTKLIDNPKTKSKSLYLPEMASTIITLINNNPHLTIIFNSTHPSNPSNHDYDHLIYNEDYLLHH